MTKLIFIGECWGQNEADFERPFVGAAGCELYRMAIAAGFPGTALPYRFISPNTMVLRWANFPHLLLNTFNSRPPENDVTFFYAKPSEGIPLDKTLPSRKFGQSLYYVKAEFAHHVHELRARIADLKPNLIVPLGATACWALGMGTAISKLRGTVHDTPYGKVLPAYHPASVLRKWNQRGITILDLFKARREMDYPEIRLTSRIIWAEPSVADCWRWWEEHGRHAERLAFDIETIRRCQISEIGFASSPTCALHIPFFWEEDKQYHNFYSLEDEVAVWQFVKHVLESDVPKAGQNAAQYDCYWLCKEMGIAVKNFQDDTMTMMHCYQPELEKSLGFLGSLFLDEKSWKQIRKHTTKDVEKDNA